MPFLSKKSSTFSAAIFLITVAMLHIFVMLSCPLFAQEEKEIPVEINGDRVEYSMTENKVIAEGDVVVIKEDVTLYCDTLDFSRDTQIAIAEGNVILEKPDGRFFGDKMRFDFNTMKGVFEDAKFYAKPFHGAGKKVTKVGENHMRMHRGYLTTCDHDQPHYRFATSKVDIYPEDKAVARNVRMLVGPVPLMYIPRFTQDLSDKRPIVEYTPGYDKHWGTFLLTRWRHRLNEKVEGTLHLDFRERKDIGVGLDVHYNTVKYGDGIIRTYYMNERNTYSKHHFWKPRQTATIERERFKSEWRHQWDIDDKTTARWQYYKLSDDDFLKDYYEREFERGSNTSTYFILTRVFPAGTLSFNFRTRVNRFVAVKEKMPEIKYNVTNTEIGDSGFYIKSISTYSNYAKKSAAPAKNRKEVQRVDTDNEISYPMRIAFVEFKPFVGGKNTYFSRLRTSGKNDSMRGIFKTGADLSTKFYRIFELNTDAMGLDINNLRHIVTPSIAYKFSPDPTILSSQLEQFDSIDAAARYHKIKFSLENKFQTKREKGSVDLVRNTVSTDFKLKEDPGVGGFDTIKADLKVTPYTWLTFYFGSRYDPHDRIMKSYDFDLYINKTTDNWYFKCGKRYNYNSDDQLTTEVGFNPNKKWKFRIYERLALDTGGIKEQEYSVQRDLHAWTMDINYNQTRGQGNSFYLVFTLKAFPELNLEYDTQFNRRKTGSQTGK